MSSLLVIACSCRSARTDGAQTLAAAAPPTQGPEYVQTLGTVQRKQRPVSRSARAWFGRAHIDPNLVGASKLARSDFYLAYAGDGGAIDVTGLPAMPYHLACNETADTCCFAYGTDAAAWIGVATDRLTARDFTIPDLAAVFAIGVTGSMVRAIAQTNDQRIVMLEGLVRDSRLTVTDSAIPQMAPADLVVAHIDDRFTYCYVKPDGSHAVRWISSRASLEFPVVAPLTQVVPDGNRFLGVDAAGRLSSIESGGVYAVTMSGSPVTDVQKVAAGAAGTFADTNGTPPRVIRIVNRIATAIAYPGAVLELAAADNLWAAIADTPFPRLARWDAGSDTWLSVGRFEGLRLLTPDGPGLLEAQDTSAVQRWNPTATAVLGGRLPPMGVQSPQIGDLCVSTNGNTTRVWILARANGLDHLYRW